MKFLKQNKLVEKLSPFFKSHAPLLISAVLFVLAGTFLLLNRQPSTYSDKKDGAPATSQDEKKYPDLNSEQKQKLQQEYEERKAALTQLQNMTAEQKKHFFIGLALDGARLRDEEAKAFAAQALGLFSEEELKNGNNQGLVENLRAVERGDFDAYVHSVPYAE